MEYSRILMLQSTFNGYLTPDVQPACGMINKGKQQLWKGLRASTETQRTETPTAAARPKMILICRSRKYHGGAITPACDFSDIITKMSHSGLVLMLASDPETLERTQDEVENYPRARNHS